MKDLKGLGHLFACVFLYYFSGCIVAPAITDVIMEALCPGRDQCSLAIYLAGFTQAITGMGTFLVTPVVGNLSDKYGRKSMLTLPMTVAIIPLGILAFGRTRPFFYTYYFVNMFASMFCDGSLQCLSLAYVADRVCEERRVLVFSVLSGVSGAGFVTATLTARFLQTSVTFQVSAGLAVVAAVYMRVFLSETDRGSAPTDEASSLLCSPPYDSDPSAMLQPIGKTSSMADMVSLFRSSLTLSRAAVVAFISSLGSSGLQASVLYYLKARFHFSKDQYAAIMLISGVAGSISQLLLMPVLAPAIGEVALLNIGLLASFANVLLLSIAWSSWVPYFSQTFVVLSVFAEPCLRTIVSKTVGPNEQGLAQGVITGISSIASIVSPVVFTPLTALFLSESTPFTFKGFSIMSAGFVMLASFFVGVTIKTAGQASTLKTLNSGTAAV